MVVRNIVWLVTNVISIPGFARCVGMGHVMSLNNAVGVSDRAVTGNKKLNDPCLPIFFDLCMLCTRRLLSIFIKRNGKG